jgi:competence protein ComEA
MMKKFFLVAITFVLSLIFASSFAAVEVNKADQAGLDGIRGIGPSLSKAILAERDKGGPFKDWDDLENRVKGISDKNSVKFSNEGLVVNGQPKEGGGATVTSTSSKSATNPPVKGAGAGSKE